MRTEGLFATVLAAVLGTCGSDESRTIIFNGHAFISFAKAACEYNQRSALDERVIFACRSFDGTAEVQELRKAIEAVFVTSQSCAGLTLGGHAPPGVWTDEVTRAKTKAYLELEIQYVPGLGPSQPWTLYRHEASRGAISLAIQGKSSPREMIESVCTAANGRGGALMKW